MKGRLLTTADGNTLGARISVDSYIIIDLNVCLPFSFDIEALHKTAVHIQYANLIKTRLGKSGSILYQSLTAVRDMGKQ